MLNILTLIREKIFVCPGKNFFVCPRKFFVYPRKKFFSFVRENFSFVREKNFFVRQSKIFFRSSEKIFRLSEKNIFWDMLNILTLIYFCMSQKYIPKIFFICPRKIFSFVQEIFLFYRASLT